MADTLGDAEAERQAADAQARDLKARIDMVVEILKYLGDKDRRRVLVGALLELRSRLRLAARDAKQK
jgi:hypothetical protein